MQPHQEFIPVTIDKSHITTIGERLYAESIEFMRELVNNAYDADAALVEIVLTDDTIEIRDNGSGMNMDGLRQYFNIGSQQKISVPCSASFTLSNKSPGDTGLVINVIGSENAPPFCS